MATIHALNRHDAVRVRSQAEDLWDDHPDLRPAKDRIYSPEEQADYARFEAALGDSDYPTPRISMWVMVRDYERAAEDRKKREADEAAKAAAETAAYYERGRRERAAQFCLDLDARRKAVIVGNTAEREDDYNWPDNLRGTLSAEVVDLGAEGIAAGPTGDPLLEGRIAYKLRVDGVCEAWRIRKNSIPACGLGRADIIEPAPYSFEQLADQRRAAAVERAARERAQQAKEDAEAKERADAASAAARRVARQADRESLPPNVFAVSIYPTRDARLRHQWPDADEDDSPLVALGDFLESIGCRVIWGESDRMLAFAVFPETLPQGAFVDLCGSSGFHCQALLAGDLRPAFDDDPDDWCTLEVHEGGLDRLPETAATPAHWRDLTWQFDVARELTLQHGESPPALLDRLPRATLRYADIAAAGEAADWRLNTVRDLLKPRLRRLNGPQKVPMLIQGLVPRGYLIGLAGDGGVGKSSLAHQLALAVSGDASEFLGYQIDRASRHGVAAVLSGEDDEVLGAARADRMSAGGLDGSVLFIEDRFGRDISAALQDLKQRISRLCVLIVDGADYWFTGNNQQNQQSNDFLILLTEFARDTGAAVFVLCHVTKSKDGGRRRKLTHANVSGAALWVNRFRQLFMLEKDERSGLSRLWVEKSNLAPDINKGESVTLRFDLDTSLHHRADDATASRGASAGSRSTVGGSLSARAQAVAAAVRRLHAEAIVAHKSGARSLHKQGSPELAGLSRDDVAAAIADAIRLGLIKATKNGLVPVPMVPG